MPYTRRRKGMLSGTAPQRHLWISSRQWAASCRALAHWTSETPGSPAFLAASYLPRQSCRYISGRNQAFLPRFPCNFLSLAPQLDLICMALASLPSMRMLAIVSVRRPLAKVHLL